MDKHLSLYICYNLNIFLYSIFNIAQRGISGRHAFLKPESSQNGQWNLRMVGQSGPQLGDRERGEGRTGWGRGQRGQRGSRGSGWMWNWVGGKEWKWSMLILERGWVIEKMRYFPSDALNNTPWLGKETKWVLLLIMAEIGYGIQGVWLKTGHPSELFHSSWVTFQIGEHSLFPGQQLGHGHIFGRPLYNPLQAPSMCQVLS